MRDKSEQPVGTLNGTYSYQSDMDFCAQMRDEHTADAERLEALTATCAPASRGGYARQAKRARADADRMERNRQAQLTRVGAWGPVVQSVLGGDWQSPGADHD